MILPRRKLLTGAAALLAYAALPRDADAWWQSVPQGFVAAGGSPIAFVAGTNVSANGGSSATTGSVDTTGCTLLVAACSAFYPITITVSDSKSNTWTKLTQRQSGTNCSVTIAYVENPTVGSGHTFTLSGTSLFGSICVSGFSGVKTASASFDQQNGAGATFVTTQQPGSVTPGEDNEIIISAASGGIGSNPFSINSSFTITEQNSGGGSNFPCGLAYIVQTSLAAVNPTWTFSAQQQVATAIATYKKA